MKLTSESIAIEMCDLKGWQYQGDKINKVFHFGNFIQAFGFMSQVALCAQTQDHHPDWSNSYKTVDITLTTHSEGGITQKDIVLAKCIDALS